MNAAASSYWCLLARCVRSPEITITVGPSWRISERRGSTSSGTTVPKWRSERCTIRAIGPRNPYGNLIFAAGAQTMETILHGIVFISKRLTGICIEAQSAISVYIDLCAGESLNQAFPRHNIIKCIQVVRHSVANGQRLQNRLFLTPKTRQSFPC